MSRPDLLPALYQPGLTLTAAERSVCAAVLVCGVESGGVVTAPVAAIAARCGMSERGLRKMRERGLRKMRERAEKKEPGEPVLRWAAGVVGVACGTLYRNSVPELCTASGTLYRNSVPDSVLCTAGTVLDSRAGVTGLPSDTTYPQASPPTPQGVSSGPAAGLAEPDLEAGAETVAAVLGVLDTDAHAGKAQAFERLLATLRHRGAIVRQRQHGELVALLASQPTAVIGSVAAAIERSAGPIRSPVGFVRAVLDDAVASVQAERAALESQRIVADRQAVAAEARAKALLEHERLMESDPEYRAKRAAATARFLMPNAPIEPPG